MAETKSYDYTGLSTREGFNKSLRHFKAVMSIISEFENHVNLADILSELLEEKELQQEQLGPIVQSLLFDKYGYSYRSHNLLESIDDFNGLISEVDKWAAVDLFVSYYHPELGLIPINPKNPSHWENIKELKKNELIVVYAGNFEKTSNSKIFDEATKLFIDLLYGKRITAPLSFKKGRKTTVKKPARTKETPKAVKEEKAEKKEAKREVKPSGKRRMTPMYSIPVTNELFHNGNVEAWKKIIQSYKAKYPDLDVYIFYEGERIHDINTLFKWGKVKHGSAILISVAGENIKDVAKLQRYLKQGASPMFEAFLRFPVNTVLNLF